MNSMWAGWLDVYFFLFGQATFAVVVRGAQLREFDRQPRHKGLFRPDVEQVPDAPVGIAARYDHTWTRFRRGHVPTRRGAVDSPRAVF